MVVSVFLMQYLIKVCQLIVITLPLWGVQVCSFALPHQGVLPFFYYLFEVCISNFLVLPH